MTERPALATALFALTALACSSATPFVATGETTRVLGEQFLATARLMDSGLRSGVVTHEQYRQWRDFGMKFQASFPLAVDLWKAARAANDKAIEAHAAEILSGLAMDLARFFDQATVRPAVIDGGA